MDWVSRVPLPFDLPSLSRGASALTAGAAHAADAIARAAARSVGALLGCEVAVEGRAGSGRPAPRAGVGRVGIELAALPAAAVLELDAGLVVALVERLAGGPGAEPRNRLPPATSLSPVETAALELIALAAVDGICAEGNVEHVLCPRVGPAPSEPAGALGVELAISAGGVAGRGRLLVPPAALEALRGPPDANAAGLALRVGASVRAGSAALDEAEISALSPGDVVLVEAFDRAALVLPGGARIAGRAGAEAFQVEGEMKDRTAGIPIALEVELARVEVSLGELARLEPGAVLPLALDRRGRVALRAGERTVARGELVDVEGAVGVRILEVVP